MVMKRLLRSAILLLVLLLTSGCAAVPISPNRTPSALNPSGPAAGHLASVWWLMFALGAVVWLLVIALLFAALLRRRRATSETPPDPSGGDTGRRWLIRGGLILPLVVLAIVFGYSIYALAAVENPQPTPAAHIKVIGRRWWWEVQYPDQNFTTANELHMPVGVPVQIELEAADVIHSFWVPELHGKMDAIPTRTNTIILQADHAGVYRGECAEYCGLQHAHMDFMVVAQSSDDYNNWLSQQQQDAAAPSGAAAQGQQVFMNAGCVFCHMVRGLDDKALDRSHMDLGPDLTHLASRLTVGAGYRTLNRGNLGGWVTDVQHVKPGVLMPDMNVNGQDLQNLLAYLEGLK